MLIFREESEVLAHFFSCVDVYETFLVMYFCGVKDPLGTLKLAAQSSSSAFMLVAKSSSPTIGGSVLKIYLEGSLL